MNDHVIELPAGERRIDLTAAVHQHAFGGNAEFAAKHIKRIGFVLAVAVAVAEHGADLLGTEFGFADGNRKVADPVEVIVDPADLLSGIGNAGDQLPELVPGKVIQLFFRFHGRKRPPVEIFPGSQSSQDQPHTAGTGIGFRQAGDQRLDHTFPGIDDASSGLPAAAGQRIGRMIEFVAELRGKFDVEPGDRSRFLHIVRNLLKRQMMRRCDFHRSGKGQENAGRQRRQAARDGFEPAAVRQDHFGFAELIASERTEGERGFADIDLILQRNGAGLISIEQENGFSAGIDIRGLRETTGPDGSLAPGAAQSGISRKLFRRSPAGKNTLRRRFAFRARSGEKQRQQK